MQTLLRKAYATLPQAVMATLQPFIRARAGAKSALLGRLAVPYEQGVYDLGRGHWEQHALRLGLTGHQAVLDLGCGAGQWLPILAERNDRVVGMDPDEKMLGIAAEKTAGLPNIKLMKGWADQPLSFDAESFNAILCYNVLHYTDHEKVIAEVSRVLAPDGHLALGLPGLGYYLHHIVEGVRFRNLNAVRYGLEPIITYWAQMLLGRRAKAVTYWTRGRVRRLLRRHGFAVLQVAPNRIDPKFPDSYLGCLYFFCAEARKKAEF